MDDEVRMAYLRDWYLRLEHAELALYGTDSGDLNYGTDRYERVLSSARKPEKRLLKLRGGGHAYFDVW